jgi:hypothetical protein
VRREITELVARNAVAMVQNAIDAVNEGGQYQAMKFLFEMVGLHPASANEDAPAEQSLAAALLRHLGIEDVTKRNLNREKNTPGHPLE